MKVKDIEKLFKRLEELTIDLPHDAASLGADFLREAVSKCRGYLNEVGINYQRVTSQKTLLTIKLEGLETEFRIKYDEILSSDRRVQALASQPQRESMVNTILLEERRELEVLRLELKSCDQVEKVIRFRHKELEQTMSALRIQRSLLNDHLRTGSFYGDEGYASRNEDGVSNLSGEDLDRLLEEAGEDQDEEALDTVTNIDGDDPESEAEDEPPKMAPKKKKAKKAAKKKHPVPEADEEGLVTMGGDLDYDDLLEGIDETPDPEPLPAKENKKKVLDPSTAAEVTEGDVDSDKDIEDFLEQGFDDDLDSLLGDDD